MNFSLGTVIFQTSFTQTLWHQLLVLPIRISWDPPMEGFDPVWRRVLFGSPNHQFWDPMILREWNLNCPPRTVKKPKESHGVMTPVMGIQRQRKEGLIRRLLKPMIQGCCVLFFCLTKAVFVTKNMSPEKKHRVAGSFVPRVIGMVSLKPMQHIPATTTRFLF